MQRDWDDGFKSFSFHTLETNIPVEQTKIREQFWLRQFRKHSAIYNVYRSTISPRGYKHTEEHRQKLSKALKGKDKPKGFGQKVSKSLRGRKKSDSHIAAMSASRKALLADPKRRQAMRQAARRIDEQKLKRVFSLHDRGWRQCDIARELDISPATVCLMINGKRNHDLNPGE